MKKFLILRLQLVSDFIVVLLRYSAQGRSQKFVLGVLFFGRGIKLQYSCSVAVLASFLPHKKFTSTDFGWYIDPYTPVATPLILPYHGE